MSQPSLTIQSSHLQALAAAVEETISRGEAHVIWPVNKSGQWDYATREWVNSRAGHAHIQSLQNPTVYDVKWIPNPPPVDSVDGEWRWIPTDLSDEIPIFNVKVRHPKMGWQVVAVAWNDEEWNREYQYWVKRVGDRMHVSVHQAHMTLENVWHVLANHEPTGNPT